MMVIGISMRGKNVLMPIHSYGLHRFSASFKHLLISRLFAFTPRKDYVINGVFYPAIHVCNGLHFCAGSA